MSEKYAAFRDFRVDPKGEGLHGMRIPPGEVIRMTEAEMLSHPLYQGFGPFADAHPPMRGWLATSVCGDDGRKYGLLQLSDKSGGRDFDESDEANIRELAALIGETLDALEADHAFLTKGGVFSEELIRTWISWKRENEVDVVRLRPHPAEFFLYYDA